MSEWQVYRNADVAEGGDDPEVVMMAREPAAEETVMSKSNDEEFERFRKSVEQTLEALPTEDDQQRFLKLLSEQASKIDRTRSLMERMIKVLDRTDASHRLTDLVRKAADNEALLKDLTDADYPLGPHDDPELMELRGVVMQAAARVLKGNFPQKGVHDPYALRTREAIREIAEEEGDAPASLRKSRADGEPLETKGIKPKGS